MTVGELINKLSDYSDTDEVVIEGDDSGYYVEISNVCIEKVINNPYSYDKKV